jgi:hypothetical protein
VRGPRRDLHRLPRVEPVGPSGDTQLEDALDDLEALRLAGVHMGLREEPARVADDVELEQVAAGVLRGPADLDLHAER